MNVIAIILMTVGVAVCLFGTIKGVSRSESALEVASFIIMPLFMGAAVFAFAMPQEPGYSPKELFVLGVCIVLGIFAVVTNRLHNNLVIKRIRERRLK